MPQLPRPEPSAAFSYAEATIPPQYHCGKCGAHGIKLWREYQTFLDHNSLLCARCACEEQSARDGGGKSYSVEQSAAGLVSVTTVYCPQREAKLHKSYGGSHRGGDQIGWRVPAVPTEDGQTFWGYSGVPDSGVAWWNRLPLTVPPTT